MPCGHHPAFLRGVQEDELAALAVAERHCHELKLLGLRSPRVHHVAMLVHERAFSAQRDQARVAHAHGSVFGRQMRLPHSLLQLLLRLLVHVPAGGDHREARRVLQRRDCRERTQQVAVVSIRLRLHEGQLVVRHNRHEGARVTVAPRLRARSSAEVSVAHDRAARSAERGGSQGVEFERTEGDRARRGNAGQRVRTCDSSWKESPSFSARSSPSSVAMVGGARREARWKLGPRVAVSVRFSQFCSTRAPASTRTCRKPLQDVG